MQISPEEKLQRHKVAIRKFKVLVRLVIANLYWLEDLENEQISENVEKNIRLMLKRKGTKCPLTIKDKSILRKPQEYRTEEDKAHLSKVIASMKVFRKYPQDVKEKLSGVTYFVYYGPGREIVKQDQEALAMYFILTGDCQVSMGHHEEVLDEWIETYKGVIRAGSTFGEVGLIHGLPRMATLKTLTDCELLMVTREDFDSVLKETLLREWNQMRGIIDSFLYFQHWDDFVKTECSTLSKLVNFEADETVLGDGIGLKKYTYFVVSGTCCIIQQLDIRNIIYQGVQYYELIGDDEDINDECFGEDYCLKFHQTMALRQSAKLSRVSHVSTKTESAEAPYIPEKRSSLISTKSGVSAITTASFRAKFDDLADEDDEDDEVSNVNSDYYVDRDRNSRLPSFYLPKIKVETHFIKICEFPKGSCFNIGELFTKKRVVAINNVNCLLVPLDFIYKHNIGNIFDLVHESLNRHVPTTQKIYKRFMDELKFKRYRKQLVKDILSKKMVKTYNTINNIPYSIRLKEGLDTEYFNF